MVGGCTTRSSAPTGLDLYLWCYLPKRREGRSGGSRFGVVQIAGFIARRIVCFVREGEVIGAGDRLGLTRFGSRVDVYLPSAARTLVRAIAGETVLAELHTSEPRRNFKSGGKSVSPRFRHRTKTQKSVKGAAAF